MEHIINLMFPQHKEFIFNIQRIINYEIRYYGENFFKFYVV